MAFRVELAPEAFNDLDSIAEYIAERAGFDVAEGWFNSIMAAIRDLSALPHRCPVAEESAKLGYEVRLLLHGGRNRRYKIYFAVHHETQTVRVLHVRHWARKPVAARELEDRLNDEGRGR